MDSTRNSNETKYLTPDPWIQLINDRVLTPFVKPDQVVIDQETSEQFDLFDTRAHAHAIARGEHDALIYLHIFAVWNGSLWRAKFDNWEDYCDEWDKEPVGVSKSSIKHKMTDIKKMLAAGATIDTIIKTLGNIPMAARSFLDEIVTKDKDGEMYVDRKFFERMPYGQDVNAYLNELADLGPVAANLAVDELFQRAVMFVPQDSVEYDESTKRLMFKLVAKDGDMVLETELFIPNVPDWAVRFITISLTRRKA